MLKQLEKHIRMMMIIPMTLLVIIISAVSVYMNYENAVSNAVESIDRYTSVSGAGELSGGAVYGFTVDNGELTRKSTDDEAAVSAAVSLAKGNDRKGVYRDYFYRLQKTGQRSYDVTLLENRELYDRILRTVIIITVTAILGVLLVVFLSITVSKNITKPVAENEEKQRRFISDTSHELKTPLSVIETSAEMQETETGKTKWLTYIQNEAEGMEKLISHLLLLSSSESRGEESYAEFDLSAKAEMCVSSFEALAYEKGISVISAVMPDMRFYGNEDDVEHIISPLTDNAIMHTPKGGKVYFTLMSERNEAVIRVQNEGEPIPDKDKDRLFDRFYRVDKARNRSEKRFGLGLSIVKAEAEKYNGRIEVKSENGMTTFTVRLKSKKNL